jgi:hypothetical protein
MKYIRVRTIPQNVEMLLDVDNIERIEPTNYFEYSHMVTTLNCVYLEVYIINVYNSSMKPLKDPDSSLKRYLTKQAQKPKKLWFDRVV